MDPIDRVITFFAHARNLLHSGEKDRKFGVTFTIQMQIESSYAHRSSHTRTRTTEAP